MKGIYYARCGQQPFSGSSWADLFDIIIKQSDFSQFFSDVKIRGKIDWQCDNHDNCGDCNGCGQSIKIFFKESDQIVARYSNEVPTHQLGEFHWDWSGHGASEHWFDDEAMSLEVTRDYCSGSGLTADTTQIVAYKRHVEVSSFRGDAKGSAKKPELGKVWAEFVNGDGKYRANWTGFAVGAVQYSHTDSNGYRQSNIRPIIGDSLDVIVETVLSDSDAGQLIACKHNKQVKVHVQTSDETKVSRYLCTACRLQGIQWQEFTGRNHKDVCPYFRRACKAVITRSDRLPEWSRWVGDNLLSSNRRLQDGDWEAYEVVYVRRKEGFVRRAIWLGNNRTQEIWMYPYAGFIPKKMSDFREKYLPKNGRQLRGYLGAEIEGGVTEDDFRSAAEQESLWSVNGITLLPFEKGFPPGYEIQKGKIGSISVVPLNKETGEIAEVEITEKLQPVYADKQYKYYGVSIGWNNNLTILLSGQELGRTEEENSKNYLLRISK
jgi:hypothetical protein